MLRRAGKFAGVVTLWALIATAPAAALTPIADLGALGSLGVRLDGSTAGENAATAMATGDANGDGRGDLLIGAPGQPGDAGEAYLVLGTTSLTNVPDLDNPPAGVTVLRYGGVAGDRLATSVHLGDVTGDSKDDIILGAPGADPGGRVDAGSVYVLPGTAAPADDADVSTLPAGGSRFDGDAGGDQTGLDVFSGDVTGSGKQDLLIGAPNADVPSGIDGGTVYVVPGAAGLAGIADLGTLPAGAVRFDGADEFDLTGYSVTSGDVLGSANDDVIIGAPRATFNDYGVVYVIPGAAALAGDADLSSLPPGTSTAFTADNGAQTGRAVATGDFAGDSREEVVYGAPFTDQPGGRVDAGSVAVLDAVTGFFPATFAGDNAGDVFGWDVALGDLTGTSKDELVVGAPSAAPGGRVLAGRAYVIPSGSPSAFDMGSPPAGTLVYDGVLADDALGSTVAAGDVNGNTREDAVLGAERADASGKLDAGSAFVLFGDNAPPIVSLSGAPDPAEIGDTVTWTATGSDPEGGALDYSFDVDQVPGFEVPFGPANTRDETYFSAGVKTGTVRARDADGATTDASDTVTVTAGEGATNCATGVPMQFGTNGPDTLSGGYGRQAIAGLGGADTISGGYNDDCLFGNAGSDTVDGGYDNDYVSGGTGTDLLKGGYGNDFLNAKDGAPGDTVNCGAGSGDIARIDPGDSVSGCETLL